jgi:hypothetical protein
MSISVKPRERAAVLQSLQAGLVPKIGLHLIQVGRKRELDSMLRDLGQITDEGASFRFVIGPFGSGKSFFLSLVRTLALQKKVAVVSADITMERRLYAGSGQAQALFSELMRNLAIKARPEGGALRNLCDGWISNIRQSVISAGGDEKKVKESIQADLRDVQDQVGGFEFAEVLMRYFEGFTSGNEELQAAALRWMRAEYTTKTEARQALGVRRIIEDENFYDSLKLMAVFARKAGYTGLLVALDEMVVLSHRLPNARARQSNYEAILSMFNDCMQGGARGLGFILAGTKEFLEDPRRGIFSYEALRTRLVDNQFAGSGFTDLTGPVIRLQCLSAEDLAVLLSNIATVQAGGDPEKWLVPREAIHATLEKANATLGAEFFKTPRDIVRSFVGLLNIIEQNPTARWQTLIGDDFIQRPKEALSAEESVAAVGASPDDDGLAAFKL